MPPEANEAPTTESPTPTPQTAATKRPLSLLAAEMFADDYHGEVPEETPDAAETTEKTAADAPGESQAEEVPAESDVSELIRQHFASDGELMKKVKFGVKVDGQSAEATADELVRSYQIQTAAEKRLEEAKTKSAEILAESTAKAAKLNERFAEAAALVESLESDLADEIKSVDMDKLRREDPAEWSAKTAEFDKRRAKIAQKKLDAVTKYHKATRQSQEDQKVAFEKYMATEHEALVAKWPEMGDPNKRKAEVGKLTEFLAANVNQITANQVAHNHELSLMARKAMLYDELKANTNAAAKKLEKVPKVLKPGTPTPPETSAKARIEKLRSTARKTGSLEDGLALLRAQRGIAK